MFSQKPRHDTPAAVMLLSSARQCLHPAQHQPALNGDKIAPAASARTPISRLLGLAAHYHATQAIVCPLRNFVVVHDHISPEQEAAGNMGHIVVPRHSILRRRQIAAMAPMSLNASAIRRRLHIDHRCSCVWSAPPDRRRTCPRRRTRVRNQPRPD